MGAPEPRRPQRDGVGVGRSKEERSRSDGSKRRRSSNRKDVSEWALRWWDPRCGASGICPMSTTIACFPGYLAGSISFWLFFSFSAVVEGDAMRWLMRRVNLVIE
uniref:Uncharacterized protein MANES_02G178100 n=1 Tax=Rhizophora mucronata TaxID=61149 RepID=A0A2P2KIR2_RHIMU